MEGERVVLYTKIFLLKHEAVNPSSMWLVYAEREREPLRSPEEEGFVVSAAGNANDRQPSTVRSCRKCSAAEIHPSQGYILLETAHI
jgi:hypothetical protein